LRLIRLLKIIWVLIKFRLDRLIPEHIDLPFWMKLLLFPISLFPEPDEPPAASLRLAMEELGPVFIKFGQLLSTRKDLFPEDIFDELAKLQDQVPPFDPALARQIVEESLKKPVAELFRSFETGPLASASVAQVHGGVLNTGENVVIKIIRPGIQDTIHKDTALLHLLATWIERLSEDGRRLHPAQIVFDYKRTILDELDLRLEAANAAQLGHNWQGSEKLYVPKIYWDYTHANILVMERIYGINIDNLEALEEQKTNMKKLAHLGVEVFFTQVFQHNFFHADMHPGNVFVNVEDPQNPQYIALDCAIIGSLTEEDKNYLASNLMAFFERDYHQVARLHVDSGWVSPDTDMKEFETVIRSVCEPIFEKPISEISFGKLVLTLFQTARRFNMEVQPQLVLLQKTLLNIEGIGRQIYPELDLWDTAMPLMERWMKQQIGPLGVLKQIAEKSPEWFHQLPEIPHLAFEALNELRQLGKYNRQQAHAISELQSEVQKSGRQTRYARWGTSTLILALILAFLPVVDMSHIDQIPIGSWVLGGIAVFWLYLKPG
jgi:ubiquinone biosynthesis protein